MICHEAPVTYRDDVALEDNWHEEVGTVGLNHNTISRLAQWCLKWLVIRQRALKNCLGQIFLVRMGSGHVGMVLPSLL